MAFSGRQAATGSLQTHPDPVGYAITQTEVITHYLRLVFWPTDLVFNYTWPQAKLAEVLPQALFICTLLAATFAGLAFRKGWAFLLFYMFTMLAPSSSVLDIPLRACEYRMYLPMTFLLVLMVATLFRLFERKRLSSGAAAGCCLAAALLLGTMAWERNQVFASPLLLWQDTVNKQPHCPLALTWLGNSLIFAQRPQEALPFLERSLAVEPENVLTLTNLGLALYLLGHPKKSLEYFEHALKVQPEYYPALKYKTVSLMALGRTDAAVASFEKLQSMPPARIDPLIGRLHTDLAHAAKQPKEGTQP